MKYYYSIEDDRNLDENEVRSAYETCKADGSIPDDVTFEHFVEGCLTRNNGDLRYIGESLPVLFEDEIRHLLNSCQDGDTFTVDNGTVLFRVWIHTVDDDGIKSTVTEYVDFDGSTHYGDVLMEIYDLLNKGKVVWMNGNDILTLPETVI